MKYKLINEPNPAYTLQEQILVNRGIPYEELMHYTHTTKDDINPPESLGSRKMMAAWQIILDAVETKKTCLIVVDCDTDGYTSSALLLNYLFKLFPYWLSHSVKWYHHTGKQHGLKDCIQEALKYDIIICPDSSSEDKKEHEQLKKLGKQVIVLDHHLTTIDIDNYDNAIIINSQYNYPNTALSGVGVVWQFCRFLNQAMPETKVDINRYLDLVAVGMIGDVMSLASFETKELIKEGLQDGFVNPFLNRLVEKSAYQIKGDLTPQAVAFYVVPYINAVVRSGTQEEKEVVFKAMLEPFSYVEVESTKRGCKLGDKETIVDMAVRVAANAKSRQAREQEEGVAALKENLDLNHKIILVLLDKNQKYVQPELRGLIANKFMAAYKRPCCILTETDGRYEGSCRGYSRGDIKNFKALCEETGLIEYVAGHENAFGMGIKKENAAAFLEKIDYLLKDVDNSTNYLVDKIYPAGDLITPRDVLDIDNMKHIWGTDMDEALIALEGIHITGSMVALLSPDKRPTLKFTLDNGVTMIKFGASQEEYDKFNTEGFVEINVVGTCHRNVWRGRVTPQLILNEYEITKEQEYYF